MKFKRNKWSLKEAKKCLKEFKKYQEIKDIRKKLEKKKKSYARSHGLFLGLFD